MSRHFTLLLLLTVLVSASDSRAVDPDISDPTEPPNLTDGSLDEVNLNTDLKVFNLSVTVTGKDRKIAVINEEVVQPGDQVSGAEVLDVTPYGATLHDETQVYEPTLLQQPVKTPVEDAEAEAPASPQK